MRSKAVRRVLFLSGVLGALAPAAPRADTLLVIAPHPDDEALIAAGRIRSAVLRGDTVKVVVVTNGDFVGTAQGLRRQAESVAAMQRLGLSEDDVVFLGYGDALLRQLFESPSGAQVFTSSAGRTTTYGTRGLGGADWHTHRHGAPAPYSRDALLADLVEILFTYAPEDVITVTNFDGHPDHEATGLFVAEALVTLERAGLGRGPRLYQGMVHWPGSNGWPFEGAGFTPWLPFFASECCSEGIPFEWRRTMRFPVPEEMTTLDPGTNLKFLTIEDYVSQADEWLTSFARSEEAFSSVDLGADVALRASVTVSSEQDPGGRLLAVNAVVGDEWVSAGEGPGAWIHLDFAEPTRVVQVNLFDRLDPAENVIAGTLEFSDGSSISVGELPPRGRLLPVTFQPKTVSWVRFTVSQSTGAAAGLSELQILGAPAASTANHPPLFFFGPAPATDPVLASETTLLGAEATDLDGDPLSYSWTADAGFVQGAGPLVLFTPPAATAVRNVRVTVVASDGRGGETVNTTWLEVLPAPTDDVLLTPAAVYGGDPAAGLLTLSSPAPAGGLLVALSSSDPGAASVPASVLVPGGARNASFPVSTAEVPGVRDVVVQAAFPAGTRGAPLRVMPHSVALALGATDVLGGTIVEGTVTLSAAAGPSGAVVQLSSSAPAFASVPEAITVAAGETTATFPIVTGATSASVSVTIGATYGLTDARVLRVSPLGLARLSLSPSPVHGGDAALGTVTLNGPAPALTVVALSSGDPEIATAPAAVIVPAGATSATFSISTAAVSAATTVDVLATLGASTQTAALVVSPGLPNLLRTPERIGASPWENLGGLSLTLDAELAPDGSRHATRAVSTGGGHALRQVVLVTPGTTYTFSFYARNDGGAAARLSVYDLTHGADVVAPTSYFALLGSSGFTRVSVTFTAPAGCTSVGVYPLRDSGGAASILLWGAKLEAGSSATDLGFGSVEVSPAAVLGGEPAVGTVRLSAVAPAGGSLVLLAGGAGVTVPASLLVPAGASTATFPVATAPVSAVTPLSVTATFEGAAHETVFTAAPASLDLGLREASVFGGDATEGTLSLPAASIPRLVTLSSSPPALVGIPGTVTVPAGATTATFPVATAAVAATTAVTLTAGLDGRIASATLTLSSGRPNLITSQAERIGAAPWEYGGAISVSLDAALAPDGTVHATRVTSTGGGHALRRVVPVVPGATYTFSFFARNDGGAAARLSIYDVTRGADIVAPASYFAQLDGAGFRRVSVTFTAPAGCTSAGVYPLRDSAGPVNVLLWGAKLEIGSSATDLGFASLAVSPVQVVAGEGSRGTVSLGTTAPAGGTTVALQSSHPAAAAVPASVVVPEGQSSAGFDVATHPVGAATTVTLSATIGGGPRQAVLSVAPLTLTLTLARTTVPGGEGTTGTVTLPASQRDRTVALVSSDPVLAAVPASAVVPAGATTAAFPVTTAVPGVSTSVTLGATLDSVSATASLTVSNGRPNLLAAPEAIGAPPWEAMGAIAVTRNAALAPDGTGTASRVVSAGGGHALRQVMTLTPGATYTFSFFVRNDGGTAARWSVYDLSRFREIVPPSSYFAQLGGSGFTRVSLTFTVPAGSTRIAIYPVRDSGGPVNLLLWGAKLELGDTMSAY